VGSSFLKRPERGGGLGSKEEEDLEVKRRRIWKWTAK
jgi:hypothetical protein